MKRKTGIGYKVIMIVLIAIIAVSGFQIGKIALKYYENQKTYKEISQIAKSDTNTNSNKFNINWKKLQKINSDVIGWIKIDDTKIDYPIVSAPDNDKYLHVNFRGEPADCGTLFADANTLNPFGQFLTIVYGHHMKDGSMFNNLKKFKERDFFDSHKTFKLFTPDKNYNVEVIAFCNQPADDDLYQPNITTEAEKQSFISLLDKEAIYKTDSLSMLMNKRSNKTTENSTNINAELVMLSTCAYEYQDARYILVGKLVA